MGAVHLPDDETLVLIGTGPNFWPLFQRSAEYRDGAAHSLDRWSRRVLDAIAAEISGALRVEYPFGGPPYAPFIRWALESGEAFQSPSGMLVHRKAGMMISYRGAAVLAGHIALPEPAPSPCETCAGQPCATACPVDALSAARGYDVAACHAYLDTAPGQDCLANGCKARRACPVSREFGRDTGQSAFHMRAFHPA